MIGDLLLPTLQWWLAATAAMAAAWPVTRRLFAGLPSGGLAFGRPLGLLACGLSYWLLGLLGLPIAGSGWLGAALAIALVAGAAWSLERGAAAGAAGSRDPAPWREQLRARRSTVLTLEAVFALGLLLFACFRAFKPDIETSGGEKWMEMAFLSAVLESPGFPPLDPWLAGHSISYYHLHYLIAGWLTRFAGVGRYLAFNLMIPLTFGMTLAGAAGLGHDLVAMGADEGRRAWAWGTGALTAFLLVLMGNLHVVLEIAHTMGWLPLGLYKWLEIKNLGFEDKWVFCGEKDNAAYASGDFWPSRFIWWWRSSRVIADVDAGGGCREIIHEFPFFSFMLGDVHPHVLTLPYLLLALGLALLLLRGAFRAAEAEAGALWTWPWLVFPVVLGALGFFNTWDLPTFMGLAGLAYLLSALNPRRPGQVWGEASRSDLVLAAVGLAGVSLLAWRAAAGLVGAPDGSTDTLSRTLVALGPVLAAAALLQALWSRRQAHAWAARGLDALRVGAWLALVALVAYLPFYLGFSSQAKGVGLVDIRSRFRQWFVHWGPHLWLAAGGIGLMAGEALRGTARRARGLALAVALGLVFICLLLQAWVAAFLTLLIGLAAFALVGLWWDESTWEEGDRTGRSFALLCLIVGLALPLAVEFIFLRDLFGNRMNSIFKFYYQAWLLLSVGGAYAAQLVLRRLPRPAAALWAGPTVLLLLGGSLFTMAAVRDRTDRFTPPPGGLTLDGLRAWPQANPGDLGAVGWLMANSRPGEAILEAPGGGYQYFGRISMATGRPTVLGWAGHEHQWRGDKALPITQERQGDIGELYGLADDQRSLDLLRKYNVRYVVVGSTERGLDGYDEAAEERFARLLKLVYDSDPADPNGTRIYRRP